MATPDEDEEDDEGMLEEQKLLQKVRGGLPDTGGLQGLLPKPPEGSTIAGARASGSNSAGTGRMRKDQLALLAREASGKDKLEDIIEERLRDPSVLAQMDLHDLIQLQLLRERHGGGMVSWQRKAARR
eukprot:TRINITY_DN59724_c0_g1_i1.p1 TRINITY_DN59724_c0_g1~~TRINITY_DN59724_c0_g1_i1.p1  ORF type:complete len:141 (-),score=43.31 TRINITY_DN59724_c0_g1_i1:110-493(-)